LLIASTRSSYEQTSGQIGRMAADIVVLDQLLEEYGPDAAPVRQMLRDAIAPMVDSIWHGNAKNSEKTAPFRSTAQGEAVFYKLRELCCRHPVQSS
jgi:hypothetical protein